MVTRFAALAAIAAGAGCYSPGFTDCELACAPPNGDCPAGYECKTLVCRPIGAALPCPVAMLDASDDSMMMSDGPLIPPHPTLRWATSTTVLTPPQGADDPSLTEDRLMMFVGVGIRINFVTRNSATGVFGGLAMPASPLNGGAADTDDAPYISGDGLTIHWMSSRSGGVGFGGNDIWRATRADRSDDWGNEMPVNELNSGMIDAGGSMSADRQMIVIASNRNGASMGDDLFVATMSPSGRWNTPTPLASLNTSSNESHPYLSPDKLAIYFHSDRPSSNGFDLWEAHRANDTVPFDPPRRLDELSTNNYEGDPWVSPDGRHMFFTRTQGTVKSIVEAIR